MRLKNQKRNGATTLLETIIALAVFSVIILITISIINLSSHSVVDEAKSMAVTQDTTTALHFLVSDVKSSSSVYSSDEKIVFYLTTGGTVTYQIDDDHKTASREEDEILKNYLVFEVAPVDEKTFDLYLGLRGAEVMQYTFNCAGQEVAFP